MKLVFLIICILIIYTNAIPCKDAINTVGHVYNCNQSNTSLYTPLQCFSNGCWCVNVTTGHQGEYIDMSLLQIGHNDPPLNVNKICDNDGHDKNRIREQHDIKPEQKDPLFQMIDEDKLPESQLPPKHT